MSSLKDFKVLAALGKGSYGSVMKVERLKDTCPYAVKEVNIRRLSPREREDALNEIRILASIKHRNIVRYCDAFTEKDNLYIVMEFAEGGDIGRQIEKFKKANKYIKEDTIWSYTIQICKALNELHSRSILHRDLKPKNVFLTGKNHVRLGDLGCAKLMKTGLARTQIGTPYYMSPEIWSNKPYDQKSDMWALGCLIYELCMLMPPFLANDMNGLAAKVKTAAAPRISKHYSDDLAALVAALLNKDPRARPDTKTILSLPAVAARLPAMPDDDESSWAGEDMRSALLATIRVPHMFGYGGKPALALPAPSYPLKRSDSAPAGGVTGEETPSAAAPVAVGGAGMVAAAPVAPLRAAPPAALAAPPAKAAFAAATSPPQLGRYLRRDSASDPASGAAAAAAKDGIMAAAPPAGIAGRYGVPSAAGVPLARAPSAGGILSSAMVAMNAAAAAAGGAGPSAAAAAVPAVKPLVSVPSARAMVPGSAAAVPSSYYGAAPPSSAVARAAAAAAVPSSAYGAAAVRPSAVPSAAVPVYRPSTAAAPSSVAAAPTSAVAAAAAVKRYMAAPSVASSAAAPSSAAVAYPYYGARGAVPSTAAMVGARPSSAVPPSAGGVAAPSARAPSSAVAAKYAGAGGGVPGSAYGMVGPYPAMAGMIARQPAAYAVRGL